MMWILLWIFWKMCRCGFQNHLPSILFSSSAETSLHQGPEDVVRICLAIMTRVNFHSAGWTIINPLTTRPEKAIMTSYIFHFLPLCVSAVITFFLFFQCRGSRRPCFMWDKLYIYLLRSLHFQFRIKLCNSYLLMGFKKKRIIKK